MKNLKEIANKIIEKNPSALISGSIAIKLQGYETRREPSDIDIWMPAKSKFIPIEGMVYDSDSDHYEEVHHHRKSFKLGEIKIDTFIPVYNYQYVARRVFKEGLPMMDIPEILKFKIEHAFDEYYEDEQLKHLQDLIFILNAALEKIILIKK